MKYRIKYITICSLAIAALAGCKRNFIELSDPNKVYSVNYIKDAVSLKSALTADYNTLQPIYNGVFQAFGDVASDNSTAQIGGPAYNLLDGFTFDQTWASFSTIWNASYKSIAQSNLVIVKGASVSMDETLRSRYLAEAKFIRALNYFNLVQLFGAVPLVTTPLDDYKDSYNYGRQPVADVYTQIVKDLTEAAAVLSPGYTGADIGRVTSGAANALLGKVYLTQKKYNEALTALNMVTGYSLLSDFNSVFSNSNEMNNEIIFAVRYTRALPGLGNSIGINMLPSTVSMAGSPGARYNNEMPEWAGLYSAGDKRAAISVVYSAGGLNTEYYCAKFIDAQATAATNAENDWIVLRYADVLLMKAEALNELNRTVEALDPINEVRQRAGLTPLVALTQSGFRLAVETERRLELCMEGHRWFDLVRTGRALEVMNAHFAANTTYYGATPPVMKAHHVLFPVPFAETQINTKLLPNNTGY
ncbi:RagB/SusD family nutrient uptake outer membrane protein [Terrimonas pollutisoli]|uniref:RagB/SusD family nutrient uptake outer membrane protein n=1 Tax=Terrimonas pollutisoli TaxID=3034147 RepID=UPI0023ECE889|nr:RagB/SusD family nutrient uptake outer membrane protein [Terrimonas sp. H1YJ31]